MYEKYIGGDYSLVIVSSPMEGNQSPLKGGLSREVLFLSEFNVLLN